MSAPAPALETGDGDDGFVLPTPESRRNLAAVWTLGIAAGALVVFWLKPALFAYIVQLPACEQLRWLRALVATAIVTPLPIAIWGVAFARRVLRYGRVPPPGTWVFRRTPIVRGRRARMQGYVLLACAFGAMTIPVLGWLGIRKTPLFVTPKSCLVAPEPAAHDAIPRDR